MKLSSLWFLLLFELPGLKLEVAGGAVGFRTNFKFPERLVSSWRSNRAVHFVFSLEIELNDKAVNNIHRDNLTDPLAVNKMLLHNSLSTDAVLVADNGTEIPCHKAFLSGKKLINI